MPGSYRQVFVAIAGARIDQRSSTGFNLLKQTDWRIHPVPSQLLGITVQDIQQREGRTQNPGTDLIYCHRVGLTFDGLFTGDLGCAASGRRCFSPSQDRSVFPQRQSVKIPGHNSSYAHSAQIRHLDRGVALGSVSIPQLSE